MSVQCEATAKRSVSATMGLFENYLSLWLFLCIIAGISLGHFLPSVFHSIGKIEVAQINLPVAVLVWLMIIPMLLYRGILCYCLYHFTLLPRISRMTALYWPGCEHL